MNSPDRIKGLQITTLRPDPILLWDNFLKVLANIQGIQDQKRGKYLSEGDKTVIRSFYISFVGTEFEDIFIPTVNGSFACNYLGEDVRDFLPLNHSRISAHRRLREEQEYTSLAAIAVLGTD